MTGTALQQGIVAGVFTLAMAAGAVVGSSEPAPPPTTARVVADASSWAAVEGPLAGLFQAWIADEASRGVSRGEYGHILSVEGATVIQAGRPDAVPAEAVAWMVQNAPELAPDILVAGSSADAAVMAGQEQARVASAGAAEEGADEDVATDEEEAPAEDEESEDTGEEPGEGDDTLDDGESGDGATTEDGDPPSSGEGEGTPDLGSEEPDPVEPGATSDVQGRPSEVFVPAGHAPGEGWGLVVALAGIAGNTTYPKLKLQAGCESQKLVYVGIKAREAGGRFRWEADAAENVTYIEEVVRTAEAEFGLDPDRTVLFGFSNGAGFVASDGGLMDGTFEGYVAVEGLGFPGTEDRAIHVSGTRPVEDVREGNRWSAFVEGMGHFIPGPPVPPFPDPGLDTTVSGTRVDADAMFAWVLGADTDA